MQDTSTSKLYRIMPFRHVVDFFESRELNFASPSSWEDPYERVLQHKGTAHTYAQCWCKRAVSDAMWRIYSSDRTAVRIRTTRGKLANVGARVRASYHSSFRLEDVTYDTSRNVKAKLDELAERLRARFDAERATDALLIKRQAFDFEAEVRAIIYVKPQTGLKRSEFFRIKIDPHTFVESILFDPRADPTYVKMATHYLRSALRFKGVIGRSELYRASQIHILDEVEPEL